MLIWYRRAVQLFFFSSVCCRNATKRSGAKTILCRYTAQMSQKYAVIGHVFPVAFLLLVLEYLSPCFLSCSLVYFFVPWDRTDIIVDTQHFPTMSFAFSSEHSRAAVVLSFPVCSFAVFHLPLPVPFAFSSEGSRTVVVLSFRGCGSAVFIVPLLVPIAFYERH